MKKHNRNTQSENNQNFSENERRTGKSVFQRFGLGAAAAAVTGLVASGVFFSAPAFASGNSTAQESAAAAGSGSSTASERITLGAQSAGTSDTAEGSTELTASSDSTANSTNSVASVAADAMPSMVAITNTSVENIQNYFGGTFGGNGQSVESVSMGTGIIVAETDDDILIATNEHVIADAQELSVAFVDNSAASATVVGSDSTNDLAVIRVSKSDLSEDTLSAIKVIKIGSSDDLVVGQQVVAIGNALGYGQSVSSGVVSALNRTITAESEDGTESQTETSFGLIQTDAAINPGNSGGALLDMNGNLVGINSAKYASTEVEGMGYAIPITEALPILEDLANGTSTDSSASDAESGSEAYLGISCATISADYASYYNIPQGVYVSAAVNGGAAEKGGVKAGDIITAIDDTTITSTDELTAALANYKAGDTVTLTVMRNSTESGAQGNEGNSYASQTLTVTLGSKASDSPVQRASQTAAME